MGCFLRYLFIGLGHSPRVEFLKQKAAIRAATMETSRVSFSNFAEFIIAEVSWCIVIVQMVIAIVFVIIIH